MDGIDGVFCFGATGTIKITTVDCPGLWHNSAQADHGVHSKLSKICLHHSGKIAVDSAFGAVQGKPCLIQSSNDDPKLPGTATAASKKAVALNDQTTMLRQTAEHGMRTIQGQFP